MAVRVPNHPVALALLERLDFPLAAPSANPFGYISPTKSKHVYDQLKGRIPYVLEGGSCEAGIESTIIGFEDGVCVVHRLGALEISEIEAIVGVPEVDASIDCVGFEARGHGHNHSVERPATVLNSIMEVTRAGGALGIPGLYVTGDPGGVDDNAKIGMLGIRIGLGWANIDTGFGEGDGFQIGAGLEHRFEASPISIGGNVSYVEVADADAVMVVGATLRFDFGNESLKARDRSGNTFSSTNGLLSFLN